MRRAKQILAVVSFVAGVCLAPAMTGCAGTPTGPIGADGGGNEGGSSDGGGGGSSCGDAGYDDWNLCGGDGFGIPWGTLWITTVTTGMDLDPDGYAVSAEGSGGILIGVNAAETFLIDAHQVPNPGVYVHGVAENCRVAGDNPRVVGPITPFGSASTTFDVSCVSL